MYFYIWDLFKDFKSPSKASCYSDEAKWGAPCIGDCPNGWSTMSWRHLKYIWCKEIWLFWVGLNLIPESVWSLPCMEAFQSDYWPRVQIASHLRFIRLSENWVNMQLKKFKYDISNVFFLDLNDPKQTGLFIRWPNLSAQAEMLEPPAAAAGRLLGSFCTFWPKHIRVCRLHTSPLHKLCLIHCHLLTAR